MQRSCLVLHIHVLNIADCYSLVVPGLQIWIILPSFCYNFIATLLWVLHCCYWNAIICLCSKTVQIHRISRSSC